MQGHPGDLVFDSSSLIDLEGRLGRLNHYLARVHIPERVVKEINRPNSGLANWLQNHLGCIVSHTLPPEDNLYLRLIKDNPGLGDGEAQVIALAYHRRWTVVTEDTYARRVADGIGVSWISLQQLSPSSPIQQRLL